VVSATVVSSVSVCLGKSNAQLTTEHKTSHNGTIGDSVSSPHTDEGDTMPDYLVELRGEAREVYAVTADSADEAREQWAGGSLYVSEASSMEVYDVREDS
jgi:hypothetical protein